VQLVGIYTLAGTMTITAIFGWMNIYDYQNNLIAEYFYDNDKRLIKKIVTDNPGINRWWVDEFEYENNRVSKIIHDDQTYQFDYEIYLSFNSQGQLIRRETFKNGWIIGHANYHY
jgi:hypothetical protein